MSTFKMSEVIPLIEQEARSQGVDPKLAVAHFLAENTSDGVYKPNKPVSTETQGIGPDGKPSGAVGLFQVVGTTLRGLQQQGRIPLELNYGTLEGQIQAGIAAVKEAQEVGADPKDWRVGAAQYVDGTAGRQGYRGVAKIPEQTVGYLRKMATAMGEAQIDFPTSGSGGSPSPSDGTKKTTTSFSTTKKVIPEDINAQLASDVAGYRDMADEVMPMLKTMTGDFGKSVNSAKEGILASSVAQQQEVQAAANREVETQTRDYGLLKTFGLDQEQLQKANTDSATAAIQMEAMKPQIDHLMSINPLANPVAWMAAQFQLGSLVPQYNALVQTKDTANQQLATRQAMMAQQKTLTPAVTLDTITQERRAKQEGIAAAAQAQMAKLDLENISAQVKFLNERMNYGAQKVNMSAMQARLMAETMGFKRDESLKAADQEMLDRVRANANLFGIAPPVNMEQFRRLPAEQQEFLMNTTKEGTTPGRAISMIADFRSLSTLQRTPGKTAMGDQAMLLMEMAKPQADAFMRANPKLKDIDALEKAVNTLYKGWREEIKDGDMTKASPNNPYKMEARRWAKNPALQENMFAKYVIGDGAILSQLGEKELLSMATARIRAGDSVEKVATELVEFFQKGYEFDFQTRGMSTLGFDSRNAGDKIQYKVSDNMFSFFDKLQGRSMSINKPADLMSLPDTVNLLTYASAKELALQAGTGGDSTGLGVTAPSPMANQAGSYLDRLRRESANQGGYRP